VQQRFPNTVPAQRAAEHHGARGFTVQLATYANKNTADHAMAVLKQEGTNAEATLDSQGRTVIRVGPLGSHKQALELKQKYAQRYPDALILP
jgi:cell division septation protein DedD